MYTFDFTDDRLLETGVDGYAQLSALDDETAEKLRALGFGERGSANPVKSPNPSVRCRTVPVVKPEDAFSMAARTAESGIAETDIAVPVPIVTSSDQRKVCPFSSCSRDGLRLDALEMSIFPTYTCPPSAKVRRIPLPFSSPCGVGNRRRLFRSRAGDG